MNHGQVHHYFGSKEGLVSSTLQRLDAEIAEQVITESGLEPSRLIAAAARRPVFMRLIAWVLLESGSEPRFGELRFGRTLASRLEAEGLDERRALVAASEVMAIAGGWALLEPALVSTNQLDAENVRTVESSLGRLIKSVLAAHGEQAALDGGDPPSKIPKGRPAP